MTSQGPEQTKRAGPSVVISKDTTLHLSIGAILAIIAYVGWGTWQIMEIRGAERDRVNALITNINVNYAQYVANTNQQISILTADLNYTSRTLEGYKSRTDRLDETLPEIKLLKHRIDQVEQTGNSHERRVHAAETGLEDARRGVAELRIVNEYIMRWVNPPSVDPPKKRNETSPPATGEPISPVISLGVRSGGVRGR